MYTVDIMFKKISKKLSIFIISFSLVFGVIVISQQRDYFEGTILEVKKAEAFDFDDISNVLSQLWSAIFKPILETAVQAIADRLVKKMVTSTINWANGGFDGDPGFINNWDGFLKDTAYETINSSFVAATTKVGNLSQYETNPEIAAEFNLCSSDVAGQAISAETISYDNCIADDGTEDECVDESNDTYHAVYNQGIANCENDIYNNWGNIAQQNYNLFQSGETLNARAIAGAIALEGSKSLNGDVLGDLIDTKNPLVKYLGSKAGVDNFGNDIRNGGWNAYTIISRMDANPSGIAALTTNAIKAKKDAAIQSAKDDLQTPEKFLDKKECVEKDDDGNCIREETTTIGSQISGQTLKALGYDQDKAVNAKGIKGTLLTAVGQLTSGLINSGFSKLSEAATASFFGSEQQETFAVTGNEYLDGNNQSDYDVLGIVDDIDFETENANAVDNDNGVFGQINLDFIGGPEDGNGAWNGGTQVIINLKENVEERLAFAEQEAVYYGNMRTSVTESKNTSILLDRCLPGPDFDWEKRYKDVLPITGDGDDAKENSIGLKQTKKMISDSKVNIPGAKDMNGSFKQIVNMVRTKEPENRARLEAIENTISTLKYIKNKVSFDFKIQKENLHPNLVILESTWDEKLTEAEQIEAFRYVSDFIYESSSPYFQNNINYYVIKTDEGETVENIVQDQNEKARGLVLDFAWDTWRDQTEKKKKQELRYGYYVIEQDLSSQETVEIAKAKASQLAGVFAQNAGLLSDCMVLKSYAFGMSISELETAILPGPGASGFEYQENSAIYTIAEQLSIQNTMMSALNPVYAIQNISSLFSSNNGGITYPSISNPRSDAEIKLFLETQYTYKNDTDDSTESIFKTDIVIDGIYKSILAFDTELEKDEYFGFYYPDELMSDDDNLGKNVKTIVGIFLKDNFTSTYTRARRVTGALFCRTNRTWDAEPDPTFGNNDPDASVCILDYYKASDLDYEVLFSGV